MTEYLDGALMPTGAAAEPLRRATQYTGEPGCIADARAFAEVFLEQLRSEWCVLIDARSRGDLLLLVSELVTNADRHSHGPYVLDLEGSKDEVAVTVYDSSAAVPRLFVKDPARIGGHGLEIVHALATEVIVERVPVGKWIKAVFRLRP